MKLKILSLLCAFGIFALGTNAMAHDAKTEAPAAPTAEARAPAGTEKSGGAPGGLCPDGSTLKNIFKTTICAVNSVLDNANCKTFCTNLSSTSPKPPTTPALVVENCMKYLNGLPAVGTAIKVLATTGCKVVCTKGSICDPCADTATLKTCGYICCPIDATVVGACVAEDGTKKTCADYVASKTSSGDEI